MKEGTYKLREDFKSPEPDKRMTRDWRKAPIIKAGTIVHVMPNRVDAPGYFKAFVGRYRVNCVLNTPRSEWRAFFDLLEPVADSPSLMCERHGWSHGFAATQILDALYREGRFTMEDISRVIQREFESDEPETETETTTQENGR